MAGHILIADDMASNRVLIKAVLAAARYSVTIAPDFSAARDLARDLRPDLAIVSIGKDTAEALALIADIKALPLTQGIEVIALDNSGQGPEGGQLRRAALEAGADDVMERRSGQVLILSRIRSLLRQRNRDTDLFAHDMAPEPLGFAAPATAFEPPRRIALITRDHASGTVLQQQILPQLRDRIDVLSPDEFFEQSRHGAQTDVFVIEISETSRADDLAGIVELRSRAGGATAGIIVILPQEDIGTAGTALDLGADDTVMRPVDPSEFVLRLRNQLRRKSCADRLRRQLSDGLRMSMIDPLTGLYNRRYALPQLASMAQNAAEHGHCFSVMVVDIDRFKEVNDQHGHSAGDAILVEVARRITASIRSEDMAARFGGEEFLVVMPNTCAEFAAVAAERMRRAVESDLFTLPGGEAQLPLTISVGVAVCNAPTTGSPQAIIDIADQALYTAKADGRNQVSINRFAA